MSFPLSSPVNVSDAGPVSVTLEDTTSANIWKLATTAAGNYEIGTQLQTIMTALASGGITTQSVGLTQGVQAVTLTTGPGTASYTFAMPSLAPTGNAQTIVSSGAGNVFYDIHPQNVIIVRKDPGPDEFSSIAAALASIPVDPAPGFPTEASPWVVQVCPGTYLEDPFTVPGYVSLVGRDTHSVIISQDTFGASLITLTEGSRIAFLSVMDTDPNYPAVHALDCGDFAIMHRIEFFGCERGLLQETTLTATKNSELYLEYISFTDSFHYSLKVTDPNPLGGFGSYCKVENFFTMGHQDEGVIIDGINSELSAQGCEFRSDGSGIGISILNSASIDVQSTYLNGWATGVFTPEDLTEPEVLLSSVLYEDCTTNFQVSTTTRGRNEGYTEYLKSIYPKASPFFVANKDQRVIVVAQKGGDFSSVAVALASITDNSPVNRYTIYIGPGNFFEPQLVMKPYVALLGFFQTSTILIATNPAVPFVIGCGYAAVDRLTLAGENPFFPPGVYPPYLIEYPGDPAGHHFRVENVVFGTAQGLVHVASTSGPAIYIQLRCLLNMQSAITNGIVISDAGPNNYPISYLIQGLVWNPIPSAFTNFTTFFDVSSTAVAPPYPNIFGIISEVTIGQKLAAPQGTGILLSGATFSLLSNMNLGGIAMGLRELATTETSVIISNALALYLNVWDISLENPNGTGTIQGSADRAKVTIIDGSSYGVTLTGPDGSIALNGQLYQGDRWSRVTNITESIQHSAALGVVDDRPAVTVVAGLQISAAASRGYVFEGTLADNWLTYIEVPAATLTLPDNSFSYIYADASATYQQSIAMPDQILTVLVGTVRTYGGQVTYIQDIARRINSQSTLIDESLRDILSAIVVEGCIASPGSSLTERAVAVGSGKYYLGNIPYPPTGGDNVTLVGFYGGTQQTAAFTNLPLQWDNAGVLTALGPTEWAKGAIYMISTIDLGVCTYFYVMGQEVFASEAAAQLGGIPVPPAFFGLNMLRLSAVILNGADPSSPLPADRFRDIRPTLGYKAESSTATSDHNSLLNLTVGDAHTQYFRTDGTRVMAGDIQLGNNDITGTGGNLFNGVDPTNHGTRHAPGGPDPIPTGTPVAVGSANSAGVAGSVARSDHVHDHGSQSVPTHHAVATPLAAGFMSATDKAKLDAATALNTPSTLMMRDASGVTELSALHFPNSTATQFLALQPSTNVFGGPNHVVSIPVPTASDSVVLNDLAATLSNKSLVDASTFVIDDVDPTRRVRLEVGVVSAATTRVLTVFDQDDTLVGTTVAQSLTNKTITDPSNDVRATRLATTGADVVLGGIPAGPNYVLVTTGLGFTTAWQPIPTGSVTLINTGTGLTGGPISSSGTISLAIPVTIANGGTNSTVALNNSRVMGSVGGSIVERAAMSDGQLIIGSTGLAPVNATLTGTANQVIVTNGPGSITLATPQDIGLASTPTFASLLLTATSSQLTLGTGTTITLSAQTPASSLTYQFPDVGVNSNVVLTNGNQTINGTKTFTTPIAATSGGTGLSSYVVGDLLYANTTSTLARLADVATGNVLLAGGVGVAPLWGKLPLATAVSGILPIANGGTNSGTALNNSRMMWSSGGAIVEAPALLSGQVFIGSTGTSPVAAFITAGPGISTSVGPGSITISAINDGTVTSVDLTVPAIFSVAGGPITTSGVLTVTANPQPAATFYGGPVSGPDAVPIFRALATTDLPTGIPNANLANSSLTINAGSGLSGGGLVSLGGATTLSLTSSSITINTAGSLTGGGVVALGGTITLTGTTSGTVTSVGLTVPSIFSVTGSPVTSSGTLAITSNTQSANLIYAGPATGVAAVPTFRAMVINDLPNSIPNSKLANSSLTVTAGTGLTGGGLVSLGGTITLNATATVTSVGLSMPSIFSVTGSPVTSSGTLTVTSNVQTAAVVYAGPATGPSAVPTFRALATTDLPTGIPNANLLNSSITINTAGNLTGGGLVSLGGTITLTGTGGTGTVTSVGLVVPSIFSVTGSPVTTSGTLTVTSNTQAAAVVYAGPAVGPAAIPTFRALAITDLPTGIPNANLLNSSLTVTAGTGLTGGGLVSLGGTITLNATATVTSVGLSMPAIFSVAGSPVTSSGTLTVTSNAQSANLVYAGPATGPAAVPTFRALAVADLPTGIPNANLANSSVTINTAGSLSGGGVVSLGGTLTLTGTASGTVTSVGLTAPVEFTVTGSPVTSSGTLAIAKATQAANTFWAGPTTGAAAQPTFRAITEADLVNVGFGYTNVVAGGTYIITAAVNVEQLVGSMAWNASQYVNYANLRVKFFITAAVGTMQVTVRKDGAGGIILSTTSNTTTGYKTSADVPLSTVALATDGSVDIFIERTAGAAGGTLKGFALEFRP